MRESASLQRWPQPPSAGGTLIVSQLVMLGFVVLYLHRVHGVSPRAAAGVLAGMTLCGGVLRAVFGYWSDRIERRHAPLRWVTIAITLSLVLVVATMNAPLAFLIPALIVAGALSVSWNGLAFTAVAELAGHESSGSALGLQQTILGICGAVTPVLFAWVVTAASWREAFALLLLGPALA